MSETWRMHAARGRGCLTDVGRSPRVIEMTTSGPVAEVEVREVAPDDPAGTYWGWIDVTSPERPVMIRAGHDPFAAQFTYGPEAEERRGKGRVVRLAVTEVQDA